MNDGLPEIAQVSQNRRYITLVVMISSLLLVISAIYFYSMHKNSRPKVMEEVYSVQNDSFDQKVSLPVSPEITTKNESKINQDITPKISQEQIAFIQEKQKELQNRLAAPLMIVNNAVTDKKVDAATNETSEVSDPNTKFMNQVASQKAEISSASQIGFLSTIIAEGTLIHAILEPATNSDLPGFLRAIVSKPTYSEDGTQILIPPGSRLIGQYKSGMQQGQSRVFVVWSRLITPSGISVNLGSSGIDSLGISGIGADQIDRHFWERFGTASLLSIIGAGAANIGVSGSDQDNSASAYRTAVASSFSQSANQSLQQESMIAPTLKTYQGKAIIVFVARDLSFQDAMKQVQPRVDVF